MSVELAAAAAAGGRLVRRFRSWWVLCHGRPECRKEHREDDEDELCPSGLEDDVGGVRSRDETTQDGGHDIVCDVPELYGRFCAGRVARSRRGRRCS